MTRPDNGGLAFPSDASVGMTYRMWLAGLALQGLLAKEGHSGTDDDAAEMAASSLRLANALIAAIKASHTPESS
jgi:hypothetical protein